MADDEPQVYVLERVAENGAGLGVVEVFEDYDDAWETAMKLEEHSDDKYRVWNTPLRASSEDEADA
jgi:hypothetical protein